MPKIIARDSKGLLVHLTTRELDLLGINNHDGYYGDRYKTSDEAATNILNTVITEHKQATALILAYSDLPTILIEGMKKLKDYADARTRIILDANPELQPPKKGK